jgi:hypothetical protein
MLIPHAGDGCTYFTGTCRRTAPLCVGLAGSAPSGMATSQCKTLLPT